MSERDQKHYLRIKSDPAKYEAYLERKRRESGNRQKRTGYETERKREWRAANREATQRIRRANHAVELPEAGK